MLRLHGGTEDERLIPIPIGKSSIGSGPRCSVRLNYDGVRPLHCLITRDDRGLRVRRWADDSRLNGAPFDEAALAPGDRLTIGSIELEAAGTLPIGDATASSVAAQSPAVETDNASESTGDSGDVSLPPDSQEHLAQATATDILAGASEPRTQNALTRTRRRKLLAALRFHHQMGVRLEQAVASLEQRIREVTAGQASTTAENAHLTDTLNALVEQVRDYRSEQAALEQRHADLLDQSRGWESRLQEHHQTLQGFEREAARSRALGDNMHRRGRKLIASLREGRESFRTLNERLAGLDAKIRDSIAKQDRWHDDMAKAIEQQSAQETQSAAWNAMVDATDRLSNDYRQLAAENSRLASEVERFSTARGELAAEKAAASEMIAMLREQYQENRQRQVEFDFQRGQWRDELRAWETRVIERDDWADRFECELKGIRSSFDAPTISTAEWKALSEQVESLTSQQAESVHQRAAWENRVADCESRIANGGEQIGAVQQEFRTLRAASEERSDQVTSVTALSEQVASLVNQQSEWGNEQQAVLGRIDDCEARVTERLQQLGEFERQLAELQAVCKEHSSQASGSTALSKQVVSLQEQQSEWEQRRSAWQGRVEQCETRIAELGRQVATSDHSPAAMGEPTAPVAEWTALSEQVASLREEQAEFARQRTAWGARLSEWETEIANGAQQIVGLASEMDGLRTAQRDQATQVTELSSLFEQLTALQSQQVEFDQLRTEWQTRVSEWERQLQQRLLQFETFEHGLQNLSAAHQKQAEVISQLATQDRTVLPTDDPANVDHERDSNAVVDAVDDEYAASPVEEETSFSHAAVATESVVESEPVERAAPAPVSYLEKYSHIFDEESEEGPDDSMRPPALTVRLHANRNDTVEADPGAGEHDANHGDEESVEQYMANLMKRIRGESHGFTASAAAATVETDVSDLPASTAYAIDASEPVAATEDDAGATIVVVDESVDDSLLNDLTDMKPKTPAPAFAADMQALRALANQSARYAIGVHTARRLRRTATTNCVIAVLAIFVGLYLLIYSPGWRSLQFAGACVAWTAALYWTKRSFSSLIQAIRLGAFQNYDDEGDDAANPPLPIDVDRSRVKHQ
jgi:uncharacterized coiled-coil DUF342 family protein